MQGMWTSSSLTRSEALDSQGTRVLQQERGCGSSSQGSRRRIHEDRRGRGPVSQEFTPKHDQASIFIILESAAAVMRQIFSLHSMHYCSILSMLKVHGYCPGQDLRLPHFEECVQCCIPCCRGHGGFMKKNKQIDIHHTQECMSHGKKPAGQDESKHGTGSEGGTRKQRARIRMTRQVVWHFAAQKFSWFLCHWCVNGTVLSCCWQGA
jgi:hypothetical protein